METTQIDYSKMTLNQIVVAIYADMRKTGFRFKPAFGYCAQQLDALSCMNDVKDSYGFDSGGMILGSFLSNVSGWKGEVAKAIKAELKKRNK